MTRRAGGWMPGNALPAFVAMRVVGVALGVAGCSGEKAVRLLEPRTDQVSTADAGALADAGSRASQGVDVLRGAACGRWAAVTDPAQALLMMVLDVSGSMSTPIASQNTPQNTPQNTRWGVEQSILAATVVSLPAAVGVGALYFPNMPTAPSTVPRPVTACVNLDAIIPVGLLGPSGSRQRSRIARSLATTQPNMQAGTPTLDAYVAGLEELGRTTLGGSRQMLLITDGQATFSEGCVGTGQVDMPVDVSPVIDAVLAARRAGIKTFVIGAPGSERGAYGGGDARPWLSRAAEAGGTASPGCSDSGPRFCHYDLAREFDFGGGLQASLADISSRLVQCDFPLPDPPDNERIDLQSTNVVLTFPDGDAAVLANDGSTACSDGWHYSTDQKRVVLCDAACNLVRGELGVKLEFLFGCPTVTRQDRRPPRSSGTNRLP